MSIHLRHFIINILFFFIISVIIPLGLCATDTSQNILKKKSEKFLEKALKAIEMNQYVEAETMVYKAIRSDSSNIKSFLLLSDISDELEKPAQKKQALKKVISLDSINFPLASKLLADIYFKEGDYANSLINYQRYSQFLIKKDSILINDKIHSCYFALASLSQNKDVQIKHLDSTVNTSLQEYWPAISTNDSLLYFTRLIENGRTYERIFISEKQDSCWGESFQMDFLDNENVNIGTMCLSSDGRLLFFTACGRNDGRGSCDVYYSMKMDNYWSRPVNAGSIVNSSFWEAQPSVSSDNKKLFFASNRPGGVGGMDIWSSEIAVIKDGKLFFKIPKNLGRGVNSRENDFSPFIHADGSTLYFSSEGRYGMGGSDLFLSKLKDTVWTEAVNLGSPINTRFNEDGLVVSPTSNVAVFSSNREGSIAGTKDLYQLKLPSEFLPEKVGYIKGYVYDSETDSIIQASIELTQLESNETRNIISDRDNGYITTLVAGKTYALNVSVEGYLFYSRHFNLKENFGFKQAERVDIYLEPIKAGKTFVLSNIFFDFDSDQLKEESDAELIQLTDFLRKNAKLNIEISGHTDNVGGSDYNLRLSENRAKAIFDYLKQYIRPDRMIYKGYGSEIPVASNDSELGRALNRRSEIKILSFK